MGRHCNLRKAVRAHWGVQSALFFSLVRGAVLPTLFYGEECWASILQYASALHALDRVLGYARRLALGLECSTSTESVLALAHIVPSRFQILQRLERYKVRQERESLFEPAHRVARRFYAAPSEIGRPWFHRLCRHHEALIYSSWKKSRLYKVIDGALTSEW